MRFWEEIYDVQFLVPLEHLVKHVTSLIGESLQLSELGRSCEEYDIARLDPCELDPVESICRSVEKVTRIHQFHRLKKSPLQVYYLSRINHAEELMLKVLIRVLTR